MNRSRYRLTTARWPQLRTVQILRFALVLAALSLFEIFSPVHAQDAATQQDGDGANVPDIRFEFNGIPYADVVERFAQMTGKAIVGEIKVEGTLKFSDPRPYTYEDALDTLNLILSMKGYVLIETDRHLRVAPKEELPQLPLKIFRGLEKTKDVRPGEVVTVVLPLQHLDATETAQAAQGMLSLAGSLVPLQKGRGVVVTDRFDVIERIQRLIIEIDIEGEQKRELKSVRLVNASGAVLAQIIERTFGASTAPRRSTFANKAWQTAPPNPEDYVTVSFDEPSRTLVLFGPGPLVKLAGELIKRYEESSASAAEMRIFFPRSMSASELASMIRQSLPGVAGPGASSEAAANKARVIADDDRERLIVMAPVADQLAAIEGFIGKVDGGSSVGGNGRPGSPEDVQLTRVFKVEHANLSTVARVIRQATSARIPNVTTVHEDSSSKIIVVVGSPGVVELAEKIHAQLDVALPDPEPRSTRFFALDKEENPSELAELAKKVYSEEMRGARKDREPDASFLPDARSKRLIVTARTSDIPKIEKILETLRAPERPAASPRRLGVVTLEHSRVGDVLPTLQRILEERRAERPGEQAQPLVLSDDDRNRLLVTATDEQFAEIREIVGELDEPRPVEERDLKTFATKGSPQELMTLVKNLFASDPGAAELQLIADEDGRRLHVLATSVEHERIQKFIETLDAVSAPSTVKRETRLFPLAKREASKLVSLLNRLYEAQLDGQEEPEGGRATLLASADDRRILVTGPAEQIALVETLIGKLDAPEEESVTRVTLAIDVPNEDATDLVSLAQKLYEAQLGDREEPRGGRATILASSDDTRVLVTGPPDQIESVKALVAQLTVEKTAPPQETRMFPLAKREASKMVSLLSRLYEAQLDGQKEPEGGRATLLASADDRRILVTGPAGQIALVETLIGKLDAPEEEIVTRVTLAIDVPNEDATDLVSLAQKLYEAQLGDREEPRGGRATILASSDDTRVLVTGPPDQIESVKALVAQLTVEKTAPPQETRIIRLQVADADELRSLIERTLNQDERRPQVRVQTDSRSRSLVLTGSAEALDTASGLVQQLDVVTERQPRELRVIDLRGGEVSRIAELVRELFTEEMRDIHGPEYEPQARILVDGDSNRLVISAPASEMGRLGEIVESLKTSKSNSSNGRAFELEHAKAKNLAQIIRETMTERDGRGRTVERVQVTSDDSTNRVVVFGARNDVNEVERLVEQLDVPRPAREAFETRFFQFTDARELAQLAPLVQRLYAREAEGATDDPADAQFLEDSDSARLIVTARPSHFERVEGILVRLKLDREAPRDRQTRVFEFGDATELKRVQDLTEKVYQDQRKGSRGGSEEATLTADQESGRLMVTGSEKEIARVAAIIEQIGTSGRKAGHMRIFRLQTASVDDIVGLVRNAVLASHRDETVRLDVDNASNSIVVSGSVAGVEAAATLIAELDGPTKERSAELRIIELKEAPAAVLATTVEQVFQQLMRERHGTRYKTTARIVGDDSSNRLLITASKDEIEEIARIVAQLDQVSVQAVGTRVFKLKFSDSESIASVLSSALVTRDSRGREIRRATVSADPGSNNVIVSGAREDVQAAEAIVKQLDVDKSHETRSLRIVELDEGGASEIATVAKQIWKEQNNGLLQVDDVQFTASPDNRRVVIVASESQLEKAEGLITQIRKPTDAGARDVHTLTLTHRKPEEIARMLEGVVQERLGEDARVRVTPDNDANRLIVVASDEHAETIREMVTKLDVVQETTPRETKVYDLSTSAAPEMAKNVMDLYKEQARYRPDARPDEVLVLADGATNRIILTAPETEFAYLEEIIKRLDQVTTQTAGTRVFRPEVADAERISHIISTTLTKQIGNRVVPRVSAGADRNSNVLVVSGDPKDLQAASVIVESLDTPSKQEPRLVRTFILKARGDPDHFADGLRELYEGFVRANMESAPADAAIIGQKDPSRLLVTAKATDMEIIEELLGEMDVAGDFPPRETRMIRSERSSARALVTMLEHMYKLEVDAHDINHKVILTPTEDDDSIVIQAPTSIIEEIEKIVIQIESQPEGAEIEVRTYVVDHSDVGELAPTLERLFAEQQPGGKTKKGGGFNQPRFEADPATKQLLVAARPEQYQAIEKLLKSLDTVAEVANQTRTFFIRKGSAEQISDVLGVILVDGDDGETPAKISYTSSLNAVIVRSTPEKMKLAEKVIKNLDDGGPSDKTIIKTIKLKRGTASAIASAVNDSLEDRGLPGERIRVTAEPNSNSLVIEASADRLPEVLQIIEALDDETTGGPADVRTFRLKNGEAEQIASTLRTLVEAMIDQRMARTSGVPTPPFTVTPDERGNTLLVYTSAPYFNLVESLLEKLDQAPTKSNRTVRYISLRNISAYTVRRQLEAIYADRISRDRPVIEVDPFGNSLTVLAHESDVEFIDEVVTKLDQPEEDDEILVRVLPLGQIPADEVAQLLVNIYAQISDQKIELRKKLPKRQQVYDRGKRKLGDEEEQEDDEEDLDVDESDSSSSSSGDDEESSDAGGVRPHGSIAGIPGLTTLLVTATLGQVETRDGEAEENVENQSVESDGETESDDTDETVGEDAEPREEDDGAEPEEEADGAESPVDESEVDEKKVVVTVDPESNSLLMSGPRGELEKIEDLIEKLTFNFVTGEFEFRIFKLKEASPVAVATMLDNLFNIKVPISVDSKGNETFAPPKLTLVIDRRSNSVVVRALPSDFVLIEKIVERLDSGTQGSPTEFRNFALRFADARRARGLVRSMVAALEDLHPGEEVVVLSDLRTNSLLIAGRAELFRKIEEIVLRVDSPSTDADNEVRFVEIKHASASQLASALRDMLRPDSSGQTTGEALALQEQVRLLRVQNEDGQPVVLDLARPIKILSDARGGNRLIITSTSDNVRALEAVAKMLDTVPMLDGVTVKFQRLTRADAETVAATLRQIFSRGQLFRQSGVVQGEPAGETGKALVHPLNVAIDERTNTLILSGQPATVTLALAVIADLDQESESLLTDVRLFRLRHASAAGLLPVLRSVFTEGASVPGAEGLSTQVTRLRALLPDRVEKTTLLPRTRRALTVQADPSTNTLVVAARSDTMPIIADVIQTMDIPAAAALNAVRIYPLEHANAAAIQRVITNLQQGAATLRAEDRAVVSVDSRTNALVVAGNDRSFSFITALVFQLDRPGDPAVAVEVLPLRYNDAAALAVTIRQLFLARQRGRTSDGEAPSSQSRVDVYADSFTNSLVVSAGKENLQLVRGLIAKVDVQPVADGGLLQIFSLKHADAQRAATMLRSLIQQGLYHPGLLTRTGSNRAAERMAISVDARTNTLIVSASPKNLAVIQQLLAEIDNPSYVETGSVRLFPLEHASVSQIAPALQRFFAAKRVGDAAVADPERLVPVSIVPDVRTNTLIVAGSREGFNTLQNILKGLDTPDLHSDNVYRVFPLAQTSADKIRGTLEQLFNNRPRRPGEPEPQPITVVSDRWLNALIVAALPEDLEMVGSLIERLDQPDSPAGRVHVIPILRANAASVSQTIASLFGAGPDGAAAAVQVSVDDRLNALVISAGEADFRRVSGLVSQLDSDLVARVSEIRVFPLQHASATELARILTQSIGTKPEALGTENVNRQTLLQIVTRTKDGQDLVSSALQEGVLVTADTRTNSLVVSAPVENLPLIEQLIYKLDTSAPQLAKIRVFSLVNADATEMARILTELFRLTPVETGGEGSSERAVRYTLSRKESLSESAGSTDGEGTEDSTDEDDPTVGTAEQDSLVVTVDGRTNSLIIGGTDHYVALAGGIIDELDSSPALERRTEIYRLRNARAADISDALQTFFAQSQAGVPAVVGTQEIGTSIQQSIEQEVSLVGEPNSNTLLVTASPRYFEEIARIIDELDQPQAQVLIQALIAEVTLDKTTALGMEFTYTGFFNNQPLEVGDNFGVPGEIASLGGLSAAVTGSELAGILRALQTDGRLEVLSRPQILAVDNQAAEINIGQSVPQITGSQTTELGNINNTIEYRDVGVILRVTPRISPDGFVSLEVEPEISSLSSSNVNVGQAGSAPIFNERKATTTVRVQNGHTIMIGGLISTDDDVRDEGIPILKSIPLIGMLFRDRSVSKKRTELIIILTPQIITTVDQADRMTQKGLERSGLQKQEGRDKIQERLLEELKPNRVDEGEENIDETTDA